MKKVFTVKNIAAMGIFGALAAILYCVPGLQFNLWFAPSFLKIHLDEIPLLIVSFAYGPYVGLGALLIKTIIKIPFDLNNMCIGVLADFMYGIALLVPASFIYDKFRTLKGALLAILIGILSSLIVSAFVGLYTIFPLYEIVYGDFVLKAFQAFDNSITSLKDIKISFEFLLPFNAFKLGIVSISTFVVYKPLRKLIELIATKRKEETKKDD